MFLALIITASSFKLMKSQQEVKQDLSKTVVIQNSNFQSRQFVNANDGYQYKTNRISNAVVSNSNFKFKGSKSHLLALSVVDFNNNTIELDEDFESSPVEIKSAQNSIYNLTLVNLQYQNNDVAIFSLDSTNIEITMLQCKGEMRSTLFKGKVTGFSLSDSTIEGFSKDAKHDIRSAIFLDHITSDEGAVIKFVGNTFKDNKIPVFEFSGKELTRNVTISQNTFTKNYASSGSCILLSNASPRARSYINIDNNTFSENDNSGSEGIIAGALKINTVQAVFLGDNYFSKNTVSYEGDSSADMSGAFGSSIYITQADKSRYTLSHLYFSGDNSYTNGGSLFVYCRDDKSQAKGNDVVITECTFTDCHSDEFGGAFATGITKLSGDVVGNNDIIISYCKFTNCESGVGGAIYVPLGQRQGGEQTNILFCDFVNCVGGSGSAIHCESYDFNMENCTFTDQKQFDKNEVEAVIYLCFKDGTIKSNVLGCSFTGCAHEILIFSEESTSARSITFKECTFESNNIKSTRDSTRGLFNLASMNSLSLAFENCKFNKNEGYCILAETGICKTSFTGCTFDGNTGTQGCVLYITKDSAKEDGEYITINNCQFSNHNFEVSNKGRATGVLHVPLSFVRFEGTNSFTGNSATFKGSSSKQNCAFGGSIFFEVSSDREVTFSNLVFTKSTSTNYGGAIGIYGETSAQIKPNFAFENCVFKECTADLGGAVYLDENDRVQYEVSIKHCTFEGCNAKTAGSSIHCPPSKFDLSHTIFDSIRGDAFNEQSLIYVNLKGEGSETKINNCTFNNNNQRVELKPASSASSSSISFNKCKFTHNNENEGSSILLLEHILADSVLFDECTFDQNGGQCICQMADIICNTHIRKCTFSNNKGIDGCAIFAGTASKDHKMIVEGCTFKDNLPPKADGTTRGAVSTFSNAIEFVGRNTFTGNKIYNGGSETYGGSLFITQESPEEYLISNIVFENSHSDDFGGAIAILAGDYDGSDSSKKDIFIKIENCVFKNCDVRTNGGAIKCGMENRGLNYDNDINITNCQFISCFASEGGALHFMDGDETGDEETIIQYCTFDRCSCSSEASSIHCRSYKFSLSHTIFKNMDTRKSLMLINLNENGIQPRVVNCSFTGISEYIKFSSGDGKAGSGSSITFSKCNFTHNFPKNPYNKRDEGSLLNLKYITSDQVLIEECLFSQNEGVCIFGKELTIENNVHIYKCTFSNNEGFTGCAIEIKDTDGETNAIIEDCSFTYNLARFVSSDSSNFAIPKGGCIHIDPRGVHFKGSNIFIGNEIHTTVPFELDNIFTFGGSLFIEQQSSDLQEYFLSNATFENCYSDHYGGAIGVWSADYKDGKPQSSSLFIQINNCTFTNCSSGKSGGAVKLGLEGFSNLENRDNDFKVINCKFIQCKSPKGGALYFMDGTPQGDEETIVQYCTFDGCEATSNQGSAIYSRSYKFELSHSIFQNMKGVDHSLLYVDMNEDGLTPHVTNCSFNHNEQRIEFKSGDSSSSTSSITFKGCNFTNNFEKYSNEWFSVLQLEHIQSGTVKFDECTFEENGGRCISQDSESICNTELHKCTFINNHGVEGCAIASFYQSQDGRLMIIEDCKFMYNTVEKVVHSYYGAIYANSGSIDFRGVNEFVGNEIRTPKGASDEIDMSFGSSILIMQEAPQEFTMSNLVFRNCYSEHLGGAIGILAADDLKEDENQNSHIFITIKNCTFVNCSSGKYGGAIRCGIDSKEIEFFHYDNDIKILHCNFVQCKSGEGGALHFLDGTPEGDEETVIEYCTFDSCEATSNRGSAVSCRSYKFEMSHSIFENMKGKDCSMLYVNMNEEGLTSKVTNCSFNYNEQRIEFTSGKSTSSDSSITFKECKFNHNFETFSNDWLSPLPLRYIQSGKVEFEGCIFDGNGGRCISQETYDDKYISSIHINKCQFINNHGADGCAIYSSYKSESGRLITVEGCTFKNNTATETYDYNCGAVFAYSGSIKFVGVNEFIGNTLHSSGDSSDELAMLIGTSVLIYQDEPEEYTVSNLIFRDCYSDHFGGAMGIFSGDYWGDEESQAHLFVHIDNCQFINCSSGKQGGAIKCGLKNEEYGEIFNNDVKITNCQFTKCKSPEGGALYFIDGTPEGDEETYIQYCTFDGCGGNTGSAIHCRSYKFELLDSFFINAPQSESSGGSSEVDSLLYVNLNEKGLTPVIKNCTFENNEQNIEFHSLGEESESDLPNSITFLNCSFTKNNQASNGADSILDLAYIHSNTVTFEDCIFSENGGQCIKQESETVCNTNIKKCLFNKNHGGSGCAIYAASGGNNAAITVEDCTFSNNKATSNWAPRGGAIYATTVSIKFEGVNQFLNNEVVYENSERATPSFYQGACGGSLYIIQESEEKYELKNAVFDTCKSAHYGGAVAIACFDDESLYKKLSIDVVNCSFTKCTAQSGGSFCSTIEGTINVEKCNFFKCRAENGGDIYCTDESKETPSTLTVTKCVFNNSLGKQHGSNVFITSNSFQLTDSVFDNMVGYSSIIYADLVGQNVAQKVTNCNFTHCDQRIIFKSGSRTGSGSSITFTHCNFNYNNQDAGLTNMCTLYLEFIQSELVTFEECNFEHNEGQCINQESNTICNTHVYKCNFIENHGFDGTAIFTATSSKGHKMTVEDCVFRNNSPKSYSSGCYGAVVAYSNAITFVGTNEFINNSLYSPEVTEDPRSEAYGGSLFIMQTEPEEYIVSGLTFTDSYSQHCGGAITIFAGDYMDNDPNKKDLFVRIENCVFNNCSSGKQGGAIKCGLDLEWSDRHFDNDVSITNCQFIKCKSTEGGALYFMDGDAVGDEETVIKYCTFDSCESPVGSAIFCLSYKFEMSHSIFCHSRPTGKTSDYSDVESVLFVYLNEAGVNPVVTNCTFYDNEQNIEFKSHGAVAEDGKTNSITFKQCNFTKNNAASNEADTILNLAYIQSNLVTFEKCLFEDNGGQCMSQEGETTCSTLVDGCTFNNNHGGSGCAIYSLKSEYNEEPYMTIKNCIFSNNVASSQWRPCGVVYAETLSVVFAGVNQFINNRAINSNSEEGGDEVSDDMLPYGGSIHLSQQLPAEYTISNIIFVDSYSGGFGGGLSIYAGDFQEDSDDSKKSLFITVENCTFTNCSSGKQGGAIKCGRKSLHGGNSDNDVNISNCKFTNCKSAEGGALYFMDGDAVGDEETVIEHCTFDNCSSSIGSAIYCRSYTFTLSHSIFLNSKPTGKTSDQSDIESFLYINLDEGGVASTVTNCTFYNNEQNIEFYSHGPDGEDGKVSSITFTKCNFTHNNIESNEADTILDLTYIQSAKLKFEECTFEDNGGCCLSQTDIVGCKTHLYRCTFNNNHGGSGCALYLLKDFSNQPYVTIEDCIFSNNKVKSSWQPRAVVTVDTLSTIFAGVNTFINNEAIQPSEDPEITVNPDDQSYGGSLHIVQESPATYQLSNLVFINSHSGAFGGALSIFAGDFTEDSDASQKNLFIVVENCTFTNCSSGKQGGAIKCGRQSLHGGNSDNDVKIVSCKFTGCQSPEGGALYFMDGDAVGDEETVIEYCTFDDCISPIGSAIYCRSYTFTLSHSIFLNSKPTDETSEESEVESFLYVNLNEGGVAPVVTNCTFENHEQNIEFYSHGPTTEDGKMSSITFSNCSFKRNNQASNGMDSILELQYIMSALVTFEDCKFEDNAGQCLKQEAETVCETHVKRCIFNKNHGGSGCAIYSATGGYGIYMTVEDCIFSNNNVTSNWAPRGGAIYATTVSVKFEGVNQFLNNEVVYENSERATPSFYQGACGGSLYIIQESEEKYELKNAVFDTCKSAHYGGAVAIACFDDESLYHKLSIDVVNCSFTKCTAQSGGSFCSTIEGTINIEKCNFFKCRAENGGDIYCTDESKETPSTLTVTNCVFNNSLGKQHGSNIFITSNSFQLTDSVFDNMVGYSSIIYADLVGQNVAQKVTNCNFTHCDQRIIFKSGSRTGSGSSITFTHCNFNYNNQDAGLTNMCTLYLEFIQSELVTFEECNFEHNEGQCINQESNTICNTHVYKCNFIENHGFDGTAIFTATSSKGHKMTVEDCVFRNNSPKSYSSGCYGAVVAYSNAITFVGTNEFINNSLYSPEVTEDPRSEAYGGSLFIMQTEPEEYIVSGLTFTDSYSQHCGGAITIFAGDYMDNDPNKKSLFVRIENCVFNNCSSGKQGGAIKCGLDLEWSDRHFDNDVSITYCKFTNCKSTEGGALYFMDGDRDGDEETVIEYCTFDKCVSPIGSAIFCRSYTFSLSHSIFSNSEPTGETAENHEVESFLYVSLDEGGVAPVVTNCTFENHEQNIEFYSHGPTIEGDQMSSITFSNCNFKRNNQASNGMDSILELQYIMSALVTFEDCKFEDNAGQCLKQETDTVCETHVKRCIFNSNHGGSGCAIYSATGGYGIYMTVEDCIFSNNKVKASWAPRGGAVYATTTSVKFEGVNQFLNNEVVYENSERATPSFYQGACGGALYLIQESEEKYELKNAVFDTCKSTHYGGAVAIACFDDESLSKKLSIDVTDCSFSGCSSTNGGSFCSTIEGKINIERCRFFNGKSENGGDIYCTDDTPNTPSTLSVSNCLFSNSQATGSGGAIYCKSGAVSVQSNNFTNCKSDTKGAAMYLAAETNASFSNNNIEMEKKAGVSAIYYTSTNTQSILWLDGGCYSTKKTGQDTSADILIFESSGTIQFKNRPCFSGSKEESIQIIGNQALDLPDEYFNCHNCDSIVVPPTPSISVPTSIITTAPTSKPQTSTPTSKPQTSGPTSKPSTDETFLYPSEDMNATQTESNSGEDDGKGSGKKSKLGTGAIVGIIIGVVVVVAAIVVLVILLMRRRINRNDIRSEQISQDGDKSAYALESQISNDTDDNHPIWAANSTDGPGAAANIDPFMNDFEEAVA